LLTFRPRLWSSLLLGLTLLEGGCGQRPLNTSQPAALVSLEQYQESYNIVRGVDYLPFQVTRDGCYARALFLAMELAAQGIPSSSTFVVAPRGGLLYLSDGTPWLYHVAPMLQVPGYAPMILDPAISAAPMRQQDWLQAMHGQNAFVYSLPGSDYGYRYGSQILSSQIVSSLDQMPPFRVEDIQHACQSLDKFWGEVPGITATERAQRRQTLANRAVELGQQLQARGKLVNAMGLTRYDCQLAPSW